MEVSAQESQVANPNPKSTTTSKEKMSVDQLEVADAVASLAEATDLPSAGDLREATTSL